MFHFGYLIKIIYIQIVFSMIFHTQPPNAFFRWSKEIRAIPYRSSRPEMFCKKGVLRNFAKFTGKHLCHSLFF